MKSMNKAAAHGLLIFLVMSATAIACNEALAQGGRGQTSREARSTSVERKAANNKKAVTERRTERNSNKTVARKKSSAGSTVGQRKGGNAVNSGRSTRRGGDVAGSSSRTVNRARSRSGNRTGTAKGGATTNSEVRVRNRDRSGRTNESDRVRTGDSDRTRARARGNQSTDRSGNRSIYVGDRKPTRHRNSPVKSGSYAHGHKTKHRNYRHNRRHLSRYGWCGEYHPAGHYHYVDAHINIGSHVYLGFRWPWVNRHRHWRPHYRYRQVVNVQVGWGRRTRQERVDVRTYYRHRVLHADNRYAEVEIDIDAIELYQNDRYLGAIDRIPGALRTVRATIHANGRIEFDRNIFIVGDARSGFEVIATRYYDDYLHNAYDGRHGYKVGRVNLRNGKVKMVSRSRLFAPSRFDGFVPISLLPEDDRLWDYGREQMDRRYDHRDEGSGWYRNYRDRDYDYDDDYELSRNLDVSYRTPQGAEIRVEKSTYLDRLD